MNGISSVRNLYDNSTGVTRKIGELENQNAQPPVEKIVPEWIYRLARISNSKPVLTAIALKPPKVIEVSSIDGKHVKLRYPDDNFGDDVYSWDYVSELEMYYVEQGKGKIVYALWHNIIDGKWYAAYTHSFGL